MLAHRCQCLAASFGVRHLKEVQALGGEDACVQPPDWSGVKCITFLTSTMGEIHVRRVEISVVGADYFKVEWVNHVFDQFALSSSSRLVDDIARDLKQSVRARADIAAECASV